VGIRVHQLAKKLGLSSKEMLTRLSTLNIEAKSHMSMLDEETAEIILNELATEQKKQEAKETEEKEAALQELEISPPVTVKELAVRLSLKPNELIAKLIKKNIFANLNQNLDEEVVKIIAAERGFKIRKPPTIEETLLKEHQAVDPSKLEPRAPVVTLMGHVDHGKTSLLDYIRKTKVTEKEAGGITQHIGAYEITIGDKAVTFLDTPGHEAFTAMRARGANATDVVVLVVAADDGVMPQTKEAIDHARAAEVPIVIAINKSDLPSANIDKVKRQLAEHQLVSENMGGKTIVVPVSAKTGQGIDSLLEMLHLEAELLELKADPTALANGVVIEGKLSPGQGAVATVLVKSGTLRTGDIVVTDLHYGKVKAMINDRGHRAREAPPSMPVEVLGLSGVPQAGENFFAVKDEKKAKELFLKRQTHLREKSLRSKRRITLEDLYSRIQDGVTQELKIILKGDVQGSIEALQKSLEQLSTKEIKLNVIHAAVGSINDADAILATASNAIIIGFNVKPEPKARGTIEVEGVEARLYSVIYEAVADVKAAMEGMLEPVIKEAFQGRATVRQVFRVSKVGMVAGCFVQKGFITRSGPVKARVKRGKDVVYEGKIESLKRFKDDVKEVAEGFECGISLVNFRDVRAGDSIETYTVEKVARRLTKK
jgi:translation initiation factor IF-2